MVRTLQCQPREQIPKASLQKAHDEKPPVWYRVQEQTQEPGPLSSSHNQPLGWYSVQKRAQETAPLRVDNESLPAWKDSIVLVREQTHEALLALGEKQLSGWKDGLVQRYR